jgi:hypothetical protein
LPNHEEHCLESLKRYGKTFSEVHRWMDEPCLILGSQHRIYRHDPFVSPKEAKAIFGDLADHVVLDHIRLDELESRREATSELNQTKVMHIPVCITVESSAKVFTYNMTATSIGKDNKPRFSYSPKSITDAIERYKNNLTNEKR